MIEIQTEAIWTDAVSARKHYLKHDVLETDENEIMDDMKEQDYKDLGEEISNAQVGGNIDAYRGIDTFGKEFNCKVDTDTNIGVSFDDYNRIKTCFKTRGGKFGRKIGDISDKLIDGKPFSYDDFQSDHKIKIKADERNLLGNLSYFALEFDFERFWRDMIEFRRLWKTGKLKEDEQIPDCVPDKKTYVMISEVCSDINEPDLVYEDNQFFKAMIGRETCFSMEKLCIGKAFIGATGYFKSNTLTNQFCCDNYDDSKDEFFVVIAKTKNCGTVNKDAKHNRWIDLSDDGGYIPYYCVVCAYDKKQGKYIYSKKK